MFQHPVCGRGRRGILRGTLLLLISGFVAVPGHGQESADGDQAVRAERLDSLREMKVLIGTLKVSTVNQGDKVEAKLLAKPLLHYRDQPRNILDATLWCFGEKGRPAALCKVEKISVAGQNRWLYCFASMSTMLIEGAWAEGKTFSATEPGVTFSSLPGAPVPANGKSERSRQINALVHRINLILTDPDLKFQENLRIQRQPIHRYDAEQAGILDGALFRFSTDGTCPDLIVLIEAQKENDASVQWKIAMARMTNCELRVRDQDRESFSTPFLRFADHLGENQGTWMYFWATEGR
jgi:hypothetical protein